MLCLYYDVDRRRQCHSDADYVLRRVRDGHLFPTCAVHATRVLERVLEIT